MKDGICPKCKAENVRVIDSSRTDFSVPTRGFMSAGIFTNYYICGECGFLEIYVEDKNALPRIIKDWKQVRVKHS